MDTEDRILPLLPETPAARAAVELVRSCESEPVANHSIRSYLFATLLAEHEGLAPGTDFDAELLFHSCVLHDLGASPSAPGRARFEVEGADLAARFLTEHGFGADRTDLVWEAIALHTSDGIAERRGVLAYLTRRGVGMDFGVGSAFLSDAQGEALHGRYPRLDMATVLVDDIVRQAARSPQAGARYTLPGEFLRERGGPGAVTAVELMARASRWGS
ncbi:HD domain-containing protein [Kitasatospora sp. NBC_00070]|uniref:HD domain-containing protein n=1 Tax=Kitasatospora sp. NBC_00070 TaxID=2975962 RepID=UPI00324F8ACA